MGHGVTVALPPGSGRMVAFKNAGARTIPVRKRSGKIRESTGDKGGCAEKIEQ